MDAAEAILLASDEKPDPQDPEFFWPMERLLRDPPKGVPVEPPMEPALDQPSAGYTNNPWFSMASRAARLGEKPPAHPLPLWAVLPPPEPLPLSACEPEPRLPLALPLTRLPLALGFPEPLWLPEGVDADPLWEAV